jgi:DNA polymerase III delta prime subunit
MHAFLVAGRDKEKLEVEILQLLAKNKAKRMDFVLQKMEDIKELSHFTRLSLNSKTAIVIQNFEGASTETQNALLKSLEEPQPNLLYILTTSSVESLLPTIVSRCEIINLEFTPYKSSSKDKTLNFINLSSGEKLAITSKIKEREIAIKFLEELILEGHDLLKLNQTPELILLLEEAQKTRIALIANGNIQLQLTNFVVNLGKYAQTN